MCKKYLNVLLILSIMFTACGADNSAGTENQKTDNISAEANTSSQVYVEAYQRFLSKDEQRDLRIGLLAYRKRINDLLE